MTSTGGETNLSHQPPLLFRYVPGTGPSVTVILAVFVALFVLLLWLHFILAQQIESIGRDIQVGTQELQRIERHNQELQRQIAIAGSQKRLAIQAQSLGYRPQKPVYLRVNEPLPPDTTSLRGPGSSMSELLLGLGDSLPETSPTWDTLSNQLDAGFIAADTP
jgi:hypothetical protein